MEDVGKFYDRKAYFTTIWYILLPFDIFYAYLVYFSNFGMLYQKIWQPWSRVLTQEPAVGAAHDMWRT
jgi:hypothetical protein